MAGGASTSRFSNGLLAVEIPPGGELVRIHQKVHGPVFFGPAPPSPPQNRFDAPAGEYRVLYGAAELIGAFVETVLRKPGRLLRRAEVEDRAWSRLQVMRPLSVAKLYDEGLQWHGTDASEIGGDAYAPARQVALELYQAFPDLDGLAYRSRYNNGQVCVALFDRVAVSDLSPLHTQGFDAVPTIVDQLMRHYGAAFDTSLPIPPP